ncbi:4-(cytidine 5'-diphospho)-2-C-methyl-D-erythritol kinase [uncultured Oscillibacter sp.]|uniref:4-(cytidine 5'-diphospho)-2-C-methyl-D-erythritol kinase n=1 Tax=uncultured Oscillibacter sp. TaxID=876091 RepID=UPI00261EF7D9|nr:4-(cytidine 5'-diphospho)-2-C-methyl-D-erythritol kinase [uncultured Oscillibacter sp.]
MERYAQAAPAKVNLALDILGRRPDGYHEMRMVMQTVSLCDTVTLEEAGEGFALFAQGLVLPGGKTLEQRAAEAFFAAIGRPQPSLRVTLEKRTPAYAGLGGGSADVAALLRLLRENYAPAMPREELEAIGGQTGSDMPFCIRGGTALAEGRGDVLTDLPPLPDCRLVICKPDFGLPTGPMFARLRFDKSLPHPDVDGMSAALKRGDLAGAARHVGNMFETVLEPPERREIQRIKEALLRHGALAAAMSGSGPAVFGLFSPEAETNRALEELGRRYAQVFEALPVGRLL